MEKYGFVYIWYDKKHKRYYVGAHWGHEDDGYVCSSMWMLRAFKIRPQDFKRRILQRVYTSKKDTFLAEEKWLQFIKIDELRIRYYNLQRKVSDYWLSKECIENRKKHSNVMKKAWEDQERREVLSLRMKKYHENNREKTSKIAKGTKWYTDGIVDRRYIPGNEPVGFYYGRTRHNVVTFAGPTGIKGICYHKRRKKYQIRMTVNKQRINIGYADTLNEANEIQKKALNNYILRR